MNGGYGFNPTPIPRGGGRLLSRLFPVAGLRSLNWSTMLSNTQKTLNIINQAIPIAYQVKPMMNNAKTMFKIIGAVKGDNNIQNTSTNTNTTTQSVNTSSTNNQPIFYL